MYMSSTRNSSRSVAFYTPRAHVRLLSPVQLFTAFGFDSRATHKHQRTEVVSCGTVCVMHVAQLSLSLHSRNAKRIIVKGGRMRFGN
jgi:4-hydroxyphenylpyruvate dioxygenase-like putative hemolysin